MNFAPLALDDRTAAKLLCMKPAFFRELVQTGALPKPVRIAGNIERWLYSDIEAVLKGNAARPSQEFEL